MEIFAQLCGPAADTEHEMGFNALDPVSGNDPRRIQLNSEAHQARLNPGLRVQIPEASIGGEGQNPNSTQQSFDGWQRSEQAYRLAGQAFDSDPASRWSRYSQGGRSRERRSIEIDGRNPVQMVGNPLPKPQTQATGDQRLAVTYEAAAQFEEKQRAQMSLLGRGTRLRV